MNALFDLRQQLGTPSAGVAEDLHIAEEEIERAQAIIRNLLEFSRTSGAEVERIDVNELLLRTVQLLQKYMQNNGVHVVTDLGAIPTCAANLNAMRQLLLNLLTNACDATPAGGAITVATREHGEWIEIVVSDTGSGIAESIRDRIFEPFVTTKGALGGGSTTGSGLGLSVSYGIVATHGGRILVESAVGQGSRFTIQLPRVPE